MPSFPVLLQSSVVDCDTVLTGGYAAKGSDQPTVETSTERPPSAVTYESGTVDTTECTLSGDSTMTKHIKTTKQVTADRVRSRSRERLITTTKIVKTITTVEKTTDEIEKSD